jgi:hypothetical protein
MRQYGPMLFRLELAGVVGAVQRSRIPDIASTVFQVALATAEAGRQWLQETVALLPDTCATPSDKQLLMQCVAQACMVDPSSHEQIEQSIWCDPQEISERSVKCMLDPSSHEQIEQLIWCERQEVHERPAPCNTSKVPHEQSGAAPKQYVEHF